MNWSLKAAKQGNPSAQTILGTIYHSGYGVPQNFVHGPLASLGRFCFADRIGKRTLVDKADGDRTARHSAAMPVLKCSGVQRSSAASTASRYVSRTFSGAPRLE